MSSPVGESIETRRRLLYELERHPLEGRPVTRVFAMLALQVQDTVSSVAAPPPSATTGVTYMCDETRAVVAARKAALHRRAVAQLAASAGPSHPRRAAAGVASPSMTGGGRRTKSPAPVDLSRQRHDLVHDGNSRSSGDTDGDDGAHGEGGGVVGGAMVVRSRVRRAIRAAFADDADDGGLGGTGQASAPVRVPHTVAWELNIPRGWYYTATAADGTPAVMRRHVDMQAVLSVLLQGGPDPNDVVAVYYALGGRSIAHPADADSSSQTCGDAHGPATQAECRAGIGTTPAPSLPLEFADRTASGDPVLTFAYLRAKDVTTFLREYAPNAGAACAILQQYVPPLQDAHNDMLQVVWSPAVTQVARRENTADAYDARVDANARMCTFEGPPHLSRVVRATTRLHAKAQRAIEAIARHFTTLEGGRHQLARLVGFFKLDALSRLTLLFVPSVRVLRPSVPRGLTPHAGAAAQRFFQSFRVALDVACEFTPLTPFGVEGQPGVDILTCLKASTRSRLLARPETPHTQSSALRREGTSAELPSTVHDGADSHHNQSRESAMALAPYAAPPQIDRWMEMHTGTAACYALQPVQRPSSVAHTTSETGSVPAGSPGRALLPRRGGGATRYIPARVTPLANSPEARALRLRRCAPESQWDPLDSGDQRTPAWFVRPAPGPDAAVVLQRVRDLIRSDGRAAAAKAVERLARTAQSPPAASWLLFAAAASGFVVAAGFETPAAVRVVASEASENEADSMHSPESHSTASVVYDDDFLLATGPGDCAAAASPTRSVSASRSLGGPLAPVVASPVGQPSPQFSPLLRGGHSVLRAARSHLQGRQSPLIVAREALLEAASSRALVHSAAAGVPRPVPPPLSVGTWADVVPLIQELAYELLAAPQGPLPLAKPSTCGGVRSRSASSSSFSDVDDTARPSSSPPGKTATRGGAGVGGGQSARTQISSVARGWSAVLATTSGDDLTVGLKLVTPIGFREALDDAPSGLQPYLRPTRAGTPAWLAAVAHVGATHPLSPTAAAAVVACALPHAFAAFAPANLRATLRAAECSLEGALMLTLEAPGGKIGPGPTINLEGTAVDVVLRALLDDMSERLTHLPRMLPVPPTLQGPNLC